MNRRIPILGSLLLIAARAGGTRGAEPGALVARLKHQDTTFEDWRPILAVGKAAVPDLKKLLADKNHTARASAAVLLYRLGETSALDALVGLLASPDAEAQAEAAGALFAFLGGPAAGDAAAPPEARAKAIAGWKAWWAKNREQAIKQTPLAALNGAVVSADDKSGLVALSLSAKHGATRGMRLHVRRGDDFVCLLDAVMSDGDGTVARIVDMSARTPPKPGDRVFWTKP